MMPEAEGKISYVGFVESEKKAWVSRNNGTSQSENEGSSDESDDKANEQEFSAVNNRSHNQIFANGVKAQNNTAARCCDPYQILNQGDLLLSMSPSNLNMGMDFNARSPGFRYMTMSPNGSDVSQPVAPAVMVSGEKIMSEQCFEDEHELKKEKKRLLNKESARRLRIRRKNEYQKLQTQMEMLRKETSMLRGKLVQYSENCRKISKENRLLLEELKHVCEPDVISTLEATTPEAKYPCLVQQSIGDET